MMIFPHFLQYPNSCLADKHYVLVARRGHVLCFIAKNRSEGRLVPPPRRKVAALPHEPINAIEACFTATLEAYGKNFMQIDEQVNAVA